MAMFECDECLKPMDFEIEIVKHCFDCGKTVCEDCIRQCKNCDEEICKTCYEASNEVCDDCRDRQTLRMVAHNG